MALFTPVKQFTHTQNPSETDSLDHQLETNFRSLQAFDPNSVVLPQLVVVGRSSGVVSGIGDTFNGIVSNPSSLNSQSNRNEDSSVSGSSAQNSFPAFDPNSVVLPPPVIVNRSSGVVSGIDETFSGIVSDPSSSSNAPPDQNPNTLQLNEAI